VFGFNACGDNRHVHPQDEDTPATVEEEVDRLNDLSRLGRSATIEVVDEDDQFAGMIGDGWKDRSANDLLKILFKCIEKSQLGRIVVLRRLQRLGKGQVD